MLTSRRVHAACAPMLAILAALAGCRAIAGLHELDYAPAPDGGCAPIVLPSAGPARARLVNASVNGSAADFCVRASGGGDWGRPIFAAATPACATGLAYATATVPFAAPASVVDVKAIAAGAPCDAPATSEADAIALGDAVTTIVRLAGGAMPERIVALREEPADSPAANDVRLRVVNAMASGDALDVGVTASSSLPTTITSALARPIAPAGVATPGASLIGDVDAAGYLTMIPFGFSVGAAAARTTRALLVVQTPPRPDTQTLFVIGDPADDAHPPRGLQCEDAAPGDAASVLATCTLSALPTLAIDTFPVSLYGAAGFFEDERRQAIYAAIAARTTDLMCIADADDRKDRQAIADAAKAHFPYAYMATPPTDLDTRPDDPRRADGSVPAAPSAPPCSGVPSAQVDAAYACAARSCSTTGDMSGVLTWSTRCLTAKCLVPFAALYQHGPQENACFDCIALNLTSFETLAYGKSACVGDARRPFAFRGQTPSMILSRYPLTSTRAYVLPGSGFRRAVLYAEVQLEDQSIDFYCAELITGTIDAELPYSGDYGADAPPLPGGGGGENGWQDEQDLQAQRAIAFIRANSDATGRPAIIAGDWSSSLQQTVDGKVVTVDLAPEVMRALDQAYGGAFVRADPPDYVPSCSQCTPPANPYGNATPTDATHTFLYRYPANATTEESFWGTEIDVPIKGNPFQPPPPGGMGTISEGFPRLVRVVRPKAPGR